MFSALSNAFKVLKSIILISISMLSLNINFLMCQLYTRYYAGTKNESKHRQSYLLNFNYFKIVGIIMHTVIHIDISCVYMK